jgi:tRNA(Leu) C34 or U34 (ribose-2'-O)-methylase TrmL
MEMSYRGFAAIGLHMPKTGHNIGSVLRAATCYDASMVAISGKRSSFGPTNVYATERHKPVIRCDSLRDVIPLGAVPVAVDLVDGAESLIDFEHPRSAFYVFGPEDGTLGPSILDWCPRRVMVPTARCMNLAATVNVVLYDRLAKQIAMQSRKEAA